jgi:sugar phosphate isomerase/epimerase
LKKTLGLSTSCMFPLSIKSTFQAAEILGYGGVEVLVTQHAATRNFKILDTYQQHYQIPIVSIHAPTLITTHFVFSTNAEIKLHRTVELAQRLGAETVVVHPPFNYQKVYAQDFLKLVNSLEQETGVNIAVENMFPWRTGGKVREMYAPSWEEITTSEKINSLTLDFSHAALSGIDTLNEIERNLNKLKHIHFCDGHGLKTMKTGEYKTDKVGETKGKVFDEHLIPGSGTQPIRESLEFLSSNNWMGNVVAEINTRKFFSLEKKLPLLAATKDYFDSCLGLDPVTVQKTLKRQETMYKLSRREKKLGKV